MTPSQWQQIVARIDAAWGKSGKWSKAVQMYDDARPIDYANAMRAVEDVIAAGDPYPPSIPELLRKARTYQPPTAVDTDRCDHPDWGIVERHHTHVVAVCRICGLEQHMPPDMPTVGDLEERTRR